MVAKKDTQDEKYFYGVGRRKASTARAKYWAIDKVIEISVNGKKLGEYFPEFYAKTIINSLNNIGIITGKFDLFVRGGGFTGQSEAARLAIAKAIIVFNSELKPIIRTYGYVTTDIRKVLPKRSGLRKNRKREQWSKR
jgi:small subunit ribosomal protein S9